MKSLVPLVFFFLPDVVFWDTPIKVWWICLSNKCNSIRITTLPSCQLMCFRRILPIAWLKMFPSLFYLTGHSNSRSRCCVLTKYVCRVGCSPSPEKSKRRLSTTRSQRWQGPKTQTKPRGNTIRTRSITATMVILIITTSFRWLQEKTNVSSILCMESFTENQYLHIYTEDALYCNQSIGNVCIQKLLLLFWLNHQNPYTYQEFFRRFDEYYDCFYDWVSC